MRKEYRKLESKLTQTINDHKIDNAKLNTKNSYYKSKLSDIKKECNNFAKECNDFAETVKNQKNSKKKIIATT